MIFIGTHFLFIPWIANLQFKKKIKILIEKYINGIANNNSSRLLSRECHPDLWICPLDETAKKPY